MDSGKPLYQRAHFNSVKILPCLSVGEVLRDRKKNEKTIQHKEEILPFFFSSYIYAIFLPNGNMLKKRHSCKNEIKENVWVFLYA